MKTKTKELERIVNIGRPLDISLSMSRFRASKALIYEGDKYLLQLRDNNPEIPCPNQWSFFGGSLDKNESPWEGLQRELNEELEWCPEEGVFLFQCILSPKTKYINYFFSVPFLQKNQKLILHEGQNMDWFSCQEIKLCPQMASHVLKIITRFEHNNKEC